MADRGRDSGIVARREQVFLHYSLLHRDVKLEIDMLHIALRT